MKTGYIKLVLELNEELYDTYGDMDQLFYYTTTGFANVIGFGEILLWSDQWDDREYDEETREYEPLKPYLLKRLKQEAEFLVKITTPEE